MAIPGLAALNKGGEVLPGRISCASAGNCTAGGFYGDSHRHVQGFVVSESKGHWGKAIGVPGLGGLNKGGDITHISVSCGSAGNCSVGGDYLDGSGHTQAFIANENKGHWGKAIEVPGTKTLNKGGFAVVSSLSCSPGGNCSAGGFYLIKHADGQGFVVSEKNGTWGKAIEIPHLGRLNKGAEVAEFSVSCGAAGNCVAAGDYLDNEEGQFHGFVVSQAKGAWDQAMQLPGFKALKARFSHIGGISCPSPGHCAAIGSYRDHTGHEQGFVASQK